MRIFLADDDDDDCFLFRDALKDLNNNHQLIVAKDGVAIMEVLREKTPPTPHYLFLDINMPLKNGLECLADIKSFPDLQTISVIMFSTSINEKHIATAQNLGAKHYIRKPRSFSGLKMVIQHVVDMDRGENATIDPSNFLVTSFE